MNYIIYDLEFNKKCLDSTEAECSNASSLSFEIIQIGALKLNENFQTVSKFNALIKPTVYPSIHPYIENLTKITKGNNIRECVNTGKLSEDFHTLSQPEDLYDYIRLEDINKLKDEVNLKRISNPRTFILF